MRHRVDRGSGALAGFGMLGGRSGKALASFVCAVSLAMLVVAAVSGGARGETVGPRAVPGGFAVSGVVGGLVDPTSMTFAPDGRLFVSQQGGRLRVVTADGRLLDRAFASVNTDSRGARGLMGVAFDPDFATNGWVYVYYTARRPFVHNRVSRFTADLQNPNVAAGGERVILELDGLSSQINHNGGALHFGPDGKLYVSVGDNNLRANAPSLDTLKGKMLRINPDGTIPEDNPFYAVAEGRNRAIWARGFRNPYTFDIQPGTGKTYINDVGEQRWEEINLGRSGANYGWPRYEGYEGSPNRWTGPIFAYRHGQGPGTGCAITGGAFYDPVVNTFGPGYQGDYFFADYCSGWIRRYDPASDASSPFASGIAGPVDLDVSEDGDLYYLARNTGSVKRISSVR
jgi:glucose/arabinose dehydrogenase